MRSRDNAIRSLARAAQASSAAASGGPCAEAGVEAEEAEDPQMVLGDALERVADEADPGRLEVGDAAEIVEHFPARRVGAQGVDGEVAAGGILAPVLGIGDGGAAAVGGDVAPQRGDLDRRAADHRGDRAVGEAGGDGLDRALFEPRDHRLRRQAGGEVDVADFEPEQGVAHAAADIAGVALAGAERAQQPLHAGAVLPGGVGQLHAGSPSRRPRLTIIAAVAPQIFRPSHSIS